MKTMHKVPSVLGGHRPQVRDPGRDAFDRVKYLRAEKQKKQNELDNISAALAQAEAERNKMRQECGNCDNCSACIGG